MKTETTPEFLARGGKITKIAPVKLNAFIEQLAKLEKAKSDKSVN